MGTVYNDVERETDQATVNMKADYYAYIEEHIKLVQKSFDTLFRPIYEKDEYLPMYNKEDTKKIIKALYSEVSKHDLSKYTDAEFNAYRRKYHQTDYEKSISDENINRMVDDEFEVAWKHHFTHNPHHAQFWKYCKVEKEGVFGLPLTWEILNEPLEEPTPMDVVSLCHLICDWNAMGLKFKNSPKSYFKLDTTKKDERTYMHPDTVRYLRILLNFLYPNEPALTEED